MFIIRISILICAYLIGSIPWGWLLGKMKGIDIRKYGSKNIGATNTGRVLGIKYAIITYILDTLKGAIFVFLFRYRIIPAKYMLFSPLIYGIASVLGHTFSIYLKFTGGKAVATGSGILLGFCPLLYLGSLIIFFITLLIKRYISLASLVSASFSFVSTIIITIIFGKINFNPSITYNLFFPITTLIVFTIIWIRHKTNIYRLKHNSESTIDDFTLKK